MKDKLITLIEFWNSEKELAIHCNTEEQAKKLLKAFDKMGKKWNGGDSYLKETEYEQFKNETVYFNDRTYFIRAYCEYFKVPMYEFEEVDLEDYEE